MDKVRKRGAKVNARVNSPLSNTNTFRFVDPFVKEFLVKPKLGSREDHSLSQDHGVTQSFGWN